MVAAETVKLKAQVKRLASSFERLKAKNEALSRALDRSKAKVELLGNSVAEGLKREKSLAEILRAISRSRTDAQPVFDAIADAALRLIGNVGATVTRLDGDTLHLAALTATSKTGDERLKAQFPCPVSKLPGHARAIRFRVPYWYSDSGKTKKALPEIARARGFRSAIFVPLLRGETAIGTISVSRREPGPFSDHDIELLKTFADQAVIAIENVRLFEELRARNAEVTEALAQQTATAEILRVISTSPTDTQPVFDAIVASGLRFFPDGSVSLRLIRNDHFETAATTAPHGDFIVPLDDGKSASSRSVLRREAVQIPDFDNAPEWVGDALKEQAARFNWRALLGAPLLRENGAIGVIGVSRPKPGAFSDKEVALLQTFANQAVIAIENVRLFKELQARNAELTQSLERQTATSEVLKIISRSTFDLEPVLQALLDNAARLCHANRGVLFRQDGEVYRLAASYNATSELQQIFQANPIVPGRGTVSSRAMLERQAVHVADVLADADYQWGEAARVGNYRTVLGVPLLREGIPIGVMGMTRDKVEPFTDQEIALVTTFADQAVIAIENVRLFKELQARNMELIESLEQQTATGKILRVISQSPTDVQPVFDTIAESAARLCECLNGVIFLRDGDRLVLAADCGPIPLGPIGEFALPLHRGNVPGRAIIDGQTVHVADLQAASGEFTEGPEVARRRGFRAVLGVPLMRDGVAIGVLGARRAEAQPFSERQVALLKTFADQAVIAIENVRLFNETKEALEQQTVISEILRVISSSPTDTQPVFDAIVKAGVPLFGGMEINLRLVTGEYSGLVASTSPMYLIGGATPTSLADESHPSVRAIKRCDVVQVADIRAADDWVSPAFRERAERRGGFRAFMAAPLLRNNVAIGAITVTRATPGLFTDKQVALLKTFADQAVIAIENVRLFNETKEALEQQTATADILRVISKSPTDIQPVLDAVAGSATRLCGADDVVIRLVEGDAMRVAAHYGTIAVAPDRVNLPLTRGTTPGTAILDCRTIHHHDVKAALDRGEFSEAPRTAPFRTFLAVPLVRDNTGVGAIVVRRLVVKPFSDKQIQLLETFADQAVIAIENVRLFNETKEALEQQTATADVLKVISSSPTDVQPVFDTIATSALRLCEGSFTLVTRFDGALIHIAALRHWTPEAEVGIRGAWPAAPGKANTTARCIAERQVVQIPDVYRDPEYQLRNVAQAANYRSVLAVPLMREGEPLGAITVARATPGLFTEKEIVLLKTFADQAVIAIQNVRLFNELQARNAELTETLEQQTVTSEILRIISSSPTDSQPVFDAIVKSGVHLFAGMNMTLRLVRGDHTEPVASTRPMSNEDRVAVPLSDDRSLGSRAMRSGEVMQIPDMAANDWAAESSKERAVRRGWRAVLSAPMMKEGVAIGVINVTRAAPGLFTDREIALLRTFADQAVIAIENARLFKELQARNAEVTEALEQQTATAEILQVISSSPTDLQPVFDAILDRAIQLCSSSLGVLGLYDGENYRIVAARAGDREVEQWVLDRGPYKPNPDGRLGRSLREGQPIHIPDLRETSEYRNGFPINVLMVERIGVRTVITVPMLKEGRAVGSIGIHRTEVRPFTQKQIDLVSTFANQAVIAIENVRLFKELQAQTEALSRSVTQLTALGEVGQAISSSLDLETVLKTIVSRALQLTGLDSGTIYEYDPQAQVFRLQATENTPNEIIEAVRDTPVRLGDGLIGRIGVTRELTQVPDILDQSYQSTRRANLVRAGYRALLAVPLLRDEHLLGVLLVHRKSPGEFAPEVVDLLKTFATHSALAIQNARLFREIAEKSRQLEVASQHKSQFLASMSHELRTPLNAILGFNEMMLDGLYGELPEDLKDPLQETQTSGRHLLRLINNVLDLAKIEAGRMELALADYSVQDMVESVRSTLRPLAEAKGLQFNIAVPSDIPLAYGDAGRLTQSLMNLAGNSLKFTKAGQVAISVAAKGDILAFRVVDTGIGIAPEKIASLFTEFKQTDATIASEYGGTGLGLAITRQFIETHGGRIWVESELGKGSTFIFEIPLRAQAR